VRLLTGLLCLCLIAVLCGGLGSKPGPIGAAGPGTAPGPVAVDELETGEYTPFWFAMFTDAAGDLGADEMAGAVAWVDSVLNDVWGVGCAFIVLGGDNTDYANADPWEELSGTTEMVAMINAQFDPDIPIISTVGNHDVERYDTSGDNHRVSMVYLRTLHDSMSDKNFNAGPADADSTTYSFDWEGVHFVVINPYYGWYDGALVDYGVRFNDTIYSEFAGIVENDILDWLEADLAAEHPSTAIVICHKALWAQWDVEFETRRNSAVQFDHASAISNRDSTLYWFGENDYDLYWFHGDQSSLIVQDSTIALAGALVAEDPVRVVHIGSADSDGFSGNVPGGFLIIYVDSFGVPTIYGYRLGYKTWVYDVGHSETEAGSFIYNADETYHKRILFRGTDAHYQAPSDIDPPYFDGTWDDLTTGGKITKSVDGTVFRLDNTLYINKACRYLLQWKALYDLAWLPDSSDADVWTSTAGPIQNEGVSFRTTQAYPAYGVTDSIYFRFLADDRVGRNGNITNTGPLDADHTASPEISLHVVRAVNDSVGAIFVQIVGGFKAYGDGEGQSAQYQLSWADDGSDDWPLYTIGRGFKPDGTETFFSLGDGTGDEDATSYDNPTHPRGGFPFTDDLDGTEIFVKVRFRLANTDTPG